MKSSKHLVQYALRNCGFLVSVKDSDCKMSNNEKDILENIEATDEALIRIVRPNKEIVGVAFIVNGLDDDELVADHTDNEFFKEWQAHYDMDQKVRA